MPSYLEALSCKLVPTIFYFLLRPIVGKNTQHNNKLLSCQLTTICIWTFLHVASVPMSMQVVI